MSAGKMAAAAAGVGRLEEEALRRKERLKALREKTGRKDKEDGEPKTKQLREGEEEGEKHRELRLRNYVPEDEDLKRRRVPQAKPVAGRWAASPPLLHGTVGCLHLGRCHPLLENN